MLRDLESLRAEAQRQRLDLSDDDLVAILEKLRQTKTALAAMCPEKTEGLEPPYRFMPSAKQP